jgi:hypothetical protein
MGPAWRACDRETAGSRQQRSDEDMARYFFHVFNGKFVIDNEGVELPDLAAVRREAIRTSGQMLGSGQQSWSGDAWRMVVADEAGALVFSVSFSTDRHGL